jgi:hypothetical protein
LGAAIDSASSEHTDATFPIIEKAMLDKRDRTIVRRHGSYHLLDEHGASARARRVTACALLNLTVAVPAFAQRTVPDQSICPRCAIEITGRVIFQTEKTPAGLSRLPYPLARDESGRFWVLADGEPPVVFGSDGHFLRVVGRSGSGPGEFQSPLHVNVLPGDSILIVDGGLQRATVIAPDFSVKRTVSLPIRAGPVAVLRWPNRVVMNSEVNSSELAGRPLHFLDFSEPHARQLGAFGENRGELRRGEPGTLVRRFFGVNSTSFWTLQPVRYHLTRFAATGAPEETLVRTPEWFAEVSPLGGISPPTSPPRPHVSLAAIRGDTLWVAIYVARPDWKAAWDGIDVRRGELTRAQAPGSTKLRMTRIEVIDVKRQRLVASRLVDGLAVYLGQDHSLIVYDEPNDVPALTLFRLRVRNP